MIQDAACVDPAAAGEEGEPNLHARERRSMSAILVASARAKSATILGGRTEFGPEPRTRVRDESYGRPFMGKRSGMVVPRTLPLAAGLKALTMPPHNPRNSDPVGPGPARCGAPYPARLPQTDGSRPATAPDRLHVAISK